MKITFCGHRDFVAGEEYEKRLLDYLEERTAGDNVEFYLGGYGGFDRFALSCCKKYKATHTDAKLIFVTPYMNIDYQKKHLEYVAKDYDEIVYPDLEGVFSRYAILYRNRYMVDKSDVVVSYINISCGGAYKTYLYAVKNGKEIYNMGKLK